MNLRRSTASRRKARAGPVRVRRQASQPPAPSAGYGSARGDARAFASHAAAQGPAPWPRYIRRRPRHRAGDVFGIRWWLRPRSSRSCRAVASSQGWSCGRFVRPRSSVAPRSRRPCGCGDNTARTRVRQGKDHRSNLGDPLVSGAGPAGAAMAQPPPERQGRAGACGARRPEANRLPAFPALAEQTQEGRRRGVGDR